MYKSIDKSSQYALFLHLLGTKIWILIQKNPKTGVYNYDVESIDLNYFLFRNF